MSLRDQLLKAGLVDADLVKKTETEKRKKGHQLKKDKKLAAAEVQQQRAEQQRLAEQEHAKRERDRELNRQREAEKQVRERQAAVKQLIAAHRQKPSEGEERFNFVDGRWIRSLQVGELDQRLLGRGQLAIVRGEGESDYCLIPRAAALRVAELEPERVLLLNSTDASGDEDDWPESWDA